ncbi:MAG: HAMP domain-containing protein [Alphaproteobacteria bacterium]|nr:HAMP domain-containing protein [Alphaproteobacteria bacterium]
MSLSPAEDPQAGARSEGGRPAGPGLKRWIRRLAAPWRTYMAWRRHSGGLLRQVAPRGLLARSLLIVIMPVLLMQTIVTYVFVERHTDTVTRRLASSIAGNIALAIDLHERLGEAVAFEEVMGVVQAKSSLAIRFLPAASLPETPAAMGLFGGERTLRRELRYRIDQPFQFSDPPGPEDIEILVQLSDGLLVVVADRDRLFPSTGPLVLIWIIGATAVLLAVAILFLRNQIRPILRLARAAEHFGRGVDVPDFKPTGAREVRMAARSFLDMKDRLQRHIQQRTEMLAGVSHDLRTPLTRMRLELELAGLRPEDLEPLKAEIRQMEEMLQAYLAFARGQAGEPTGLVELDGLLAEVVAATVREGHAVEMGPAAPGRLTARPGALRRCITNLVRNAAGHADHVRVSLTRDREMVRILVDDDGPGIPEARREEAFRPFHRLDEGRNLDTGGVGLGLAIARDIARGHGGDVVLEDSPLGGLRAVIELPAGPPLPGHG